MAGPERRRARIALISLGLYALAVVAVGVFVRVRLWDMRTIDSNLIDYSWQIELVWRASRGEWSGRDFFFPMGPLWQACGLVGTLGRPFSAGGAIAGLQATSELVGIAIAFWLGRKVTHPWLRVVVVGTLMVISYGAGIQTFRSMLSALQIFLYARDIELERPVRWQSAMLASAVATALLLLSADRLVLATLAVAAMSVYELCARRRVGLALRPALERVGYYAAAQTAWLGVLALGAAIAGANPLRFVREQRALSASYAVNLGREAEKSDARGAIAFAIAAALIALALILLKRRQFLDGMWIFGALPMTAFAVVQPTAGHVFMGLVPLLVVLVVVFGRHHPNHPATSVLAGLLGATFVVAWFGKYSDNFWLGSKPWAEAWSIVHSGKAAQDDFQTDLGSATAWLRALAKREPVPCVGLSPALTAAHALVGIPGPTATSLRWSAEQRHVLAGEIRSARCPYFIYQIGSFDRPDRPNWFIGEDLVTIAELYEPFELIGPATVAMKLRDSESTVRSTVIGSPDLGREQELAVGDSKNLAFDAPLEAPDLLRIEYSFRTNRLAAMLGAAPKLEYRFESAGNALSDWVPFSDLTLGRRTTAFFAVRPSVAESRFIGTPRIQDATRADGIRFRIQPRGRLSPARAEIVVHRLERVSPTREVRGESAAPCRGAVDLLAEVEQGRALPRNVALRPQEKRFLLHPTTPPAEPPAEVYFPIRPCAESCFSADIGVAAPAGSGDGAIFELHVVDAPNRPRLAARTIFPGEAARHVEIRLDAWRNKDVLLRLGTQIVRSPENDYVYVQSARIERCSARRTLALALANGKATIAQGKLEPEGDDLVLDGDLGEVAYPFQVVADTCVRAKLVLEGDDPNLVVAYTMFLRADDLSHELAIGALTQAHAEAVIAPMSLHDWLSRSVELHIGLERKNGQGGRAILRDARVGRCSEP